MYKKPWLSYREQLEKLKNRGLSVTDEPKALEYLERIGYYRLSGYWHVWRQLSCPVRDNYDGRLGGLTFYSFQPA